MAIDASKLKRRLPSPPPMEEGAPGINRQPEPPPPAEPPAAARASGPTAVLEGRSVRATGRVHQLNVKVTAETKASILKLAEERGLLVAEVIEQAVEALGGTKGRKAAS